MLCGTSLVQVHRSLHFRILTTNTEHRNETPLSGTVPAHRLFEALLFLFSSFLSNPQYFHKSQATLHLRKFPYSIVSDDATQAVSAVAFRHSSSRDVVLFPVHPSLIFNCLPQLRGFSPAPTSQSLQRGNRFENRRLRVCLFFEVPVVMGAAQPPCLLVLRSF